MTVGRIKGVPAAVRVWQCLGFCLWLMLPALPLGAQDWDCGADQCEEQAPTVFYVQSGTFQSGAALSPIDEADLVAALEQQSQREFEFAVNEAAVIVASLSRVDDAAGLSPVQVLMWRSPDGETYAPLDVGGAVAAGDLLLIAVRQDREVQDDRVTYRPASWTLEIAQHRQLSPTDLPAGQPLPPTLVSADGDPEPEEVADPAGLPVVEGAAGLRDSTETCPTDDCGDATPAPADDLAVELQRELVRVGCYRAQIDGLWGPASRAALQAFAAATGSDEFGDLPSARALVRVSQAGAGTCTGE